MKNLTTEDTENTERENDLQCELAAWELLREARELLASAKTTRDHIIKREIEMQKERDEAREVASGLAIQEERVNEAQKELSSIHQWIDRNHPDGFIDSQTYRQNLERVTENWYDRIDAIEADARRFVRERDEARAAIPDGEWVAYEDHQKVHDAASRLLVAINKQLPIGCFTLVSSEYYRLQNAIYGKEGAK
jgi:hypothetical protein